jgi:hypothetical protein
MPAEQIAVRRPILLFSLLIGAVTSWPQPAAPPADALSPAEAQALVERALAHELKSAQDSGHPMRYVLRKSSLHLTTTKVIVETRDGAVARLLSINDSALSPESEEKEQARLDALLRDPGQQRHRKQAEDADTGRALKVLRALPAAFLYHYEGCADTADGKVQKFSFKPNPDFNPPDLETEVLTAMSGELWIDAAQERVTHLEGHLQRDVDFGWGVLGRLDKGGWITIEQAEVGGGAWRMVRFQMQMNGRVFWKTRVFDMKEEETQFVPVAAELNYSQAVEMLRGDSGSANTGP